MRYLLVIGVSLVLVYCYAIISFRMKYRRLL